MQPFSDSLSKSRDDLVNIAASRQQQQQQQLHYSRRRHHGSSPNLSLDQTDNLRRRWVKDQTYHTYLHMLKMVIGEGHVRKEFEIGGELELVWTLALAKANGNTETPYTNVLTVVCLYVVVR